MHLISIHRFYKLFLSFFYLLLHQSVVHNLQLLALSLGPSSGRCLEQGKHRHPFAASITSLPRVINGSYYVTNLPFPNVYFRSLPRLAFSQAVQWITLSSPGCKSRRFFARCAGRCYSQSNWIPPRHRMKQFLCVFHLEWPSFVVPCLVVAKTDGPIWLISEPRESVLMIYCCFCVLSSLIEVTLLSTRANKIGADEHLVIVVCCCPLASPSFDLQFNRGCQAILYSCAFVADVFAVTDVLWL